jgi:IS30 family transposase
MEKYQHLTQRQRYIIVDLLSLKKTKSFIARELNVHRSTITREIKRNSNLKGRYNALGAERYAQSRRMEAYQFRHKIEGLLEQVVVEKLQVGWSPEQISGRLKLEGRFKVSHETIYRWIYNMAPEMKRCLRFKWRRRRRCGKRRRRGLEKYPRKLIDIRPEAATFRAELGHWERDLLEGLRGKSALLVLNDRKSRLTKIKRVQSHHSLHVNKQTVKAIGKEPCKSITNDNGIEFGKYEDLEKKTSSPVYYCHAYTSWERGTVENTNGLIRHIFPKKTDFNKLSESEIKNLEYQLNNRPRKMFNFRSAHEIHYEKNKKLIRSRSSLYRDLNQRLEEIFQQSLVDAGVALKC